MGNFYNVSLLYVSHTHTHTYILFHHALLLLLTVSQKSEVAQRDLKNTRAHARAHTHTMGMREQTEG